MPTFHYRAITSTGQTVSNNMEEASKIRCISRLKRNGLSPISVTRVVSLNGRKKATKKKNNFIEKNEGLRSKMISATITKQKRKQKSFVAQLDEMLAQSGKVTARDVRVFTQNFYLLKKARFNNIHALSTVIETTENPRLRMVLEDVLAGVESGQYMYTTMEYYEDVFPYIFVNMVKVGELSGTLENSLEQAVKYLDDNAALMKKLKGILIPNLAMFFGIILMLVVAVLLGVPMLQGVFDELGGGSLPEITLKFANFVNWVIAHWYIPVGLIVARCCCIFLVDIKSKRKIQIRLF